MMASWIRVLGISCLGCSQRRWPSRFGESPVEGAGGVGGKAVKAMVLVDAGFAQTLHPQQYYLQPGRFMRIRTADIRPP